MVSFTEAKSKSELPKPLALRSSSTKPMLGRYNLWTYFLVVGILVVLSDFAWAVAITPLTESNVALNVALRVAFTGLQISAFIYPLRGLRTLGGYFRDYESKLIPRIPDGVGSYFKEIQACIDAINGIDYKNAELEELRKEKEREQNQFFANVSHELRTPLTTIQGSLDMLAEGDLGELTEDQQHWVENAQAAMLRLMPMVNNIIEISKAEAGRIEVERVPIVVNDEIEAIQGQFEAALMKKNLTFEIDAEAGLPEILGDPFRFRTVLHNLMSNAVKYTPEGGTIRLAIYLCDDDPQTVCFEVADNGVGISEEGLRHLGEKFFQVRVRDAAKGSGLGIAIVKELLTLMHGDLQVESKVGEGTKFKVRMPVADEESQRAC